MASGSARYSGIATRYASALYELADEQKCLDEVAADLRALKGLLEDSEDLRRLVRSPVIGRAAQADAILAVLDRAGTVDLVRRFVGVVARNRRLFALDTIADAYLVLLASRRGEVAIEVTSATELSAVQVDAIGAALRDTVGDNLAIERRIDPELIGGLVVQIGSRLVDSSLRTKLQRLQLAMKGVG